MKTHSSLLAALLAAGVMAGACSTRSNSAAGAGGNSSTAGSVGEGGSSNTGGSVGGSPGGGDGGSSQSGGAAGSSDGSGGSQAGGGTSGGTGGMGGASVRPDGGLGGTAGTGGSTGTGGDPTSACTGTASGTAANTLTVNADTAENLIADGIFGVLMERLGRNWQGGIFVGTGSSIPNTDGMRNDVIQAFKDAGVGMIEWPGGCAANNYNWSASKAPGNDVGTDRYMELTTLLGIPPYLAGPGTAAAAASSRDWVTYVNQNAAHPDWTLNYFKIGNEVWGSCGGNTPQTEATYETNYLANRDLLSAPINGKPLNLIASTGLIGNWTWFDAEIMNLAGRVDGVEIHDYLYHVASSSLPIPNVGFTDAQYYAIVNEANRGQIGPRLDRIIQTLDQFDPTKHIKIWEDEWGDWTMPFTSGDAFFQQGTLMDAISVAEQLHLFMQHADRVAMAGLAQGINVIHSLLLTRSTDAALVKTPSFYVFKMFLPHHRSNAKWAPNTLVSENITGNGQTFPVLSAGSTVDNQGRVNISLANVDLVNSRTIRITINSSKTSYAANAQLITGPAKDSINDYAQAETVNLQALPGTSCSVSGKTVQVTLPSKSVVMLVLTPTA